MSQPFSLMPKYRLNPSNHHLFSGGLLDQLGKRVLHRHQPGRRGLQCQFGRVNVLHSRPHRPLVRHHQFDRQSARLGLQRAKRWSVPSRRRAGRPAAEQRRSHSHQSGPFLDGHLKIPAHAHAQLGQRRAQDLFALGL